MKIFKRASLSIVFLGAFLVAGCGDSSTEPRNVDINGIWSGTTSGVTATLNMIEEGGEISGSGTMEASTGVIPTEIEGTRDGIVVSFTLSVEGFLPAEFEGEIMNENSISGLLNESGFENSEIELVR